MDLQGSSSEVAFCLYYRYPLRDPVMGAAMEAAGQARPLVEPGYAGPQWKLTYLGALAYHRHLIDSNHPNTGWTEMVGWFVTELKQKECAHPTLGESPETIRCLYGCEYQQCTECQLDIMLHKESCPAHIKR